MKKHFTIILYLLVTCVTGFAQQSMEDKRREVENAKIAYITKEIDLKPEQAEKFWPMYNEYSDKRRALKFKIKQLRNKFDDKSLTDEELNLTFDKIIEIKQQEIQLDIAYKERLLHIISIRQLVALYEAEKEFIRMIIRKAREKQHY